ncbi:MAG: ferritin [Bacteroidetes bacterium]|nr:MAG: ferritin [Bacteroidota bacterium]TAG91701.1 MAG: ferritin [Bacteroidota bacterium]
MKKDLVRMKTALSQEVITALNEQIKMESRSSAKYLAMASWCGEHGFSNSEDFFMLQAEEERMHMLKIFKYLGDSGAKALSPEVTDIQQEYASLRDIFETSLEQEIAVTHSIHRIVDACRKNRDYTTELFMQWFIREQMEEEFVARRILDLFEMIGEEGQGLYWIDQHIAKVRTEGSPETGASATAAE